MKAPRTLFALALLLLAGCTGFKPQPGPGPDPAGRYTPLTTPFIMVGDSQEHESTGYPLHDNDNAIDSYVEVAQRPPEQTLFGRRILEWAMGSHPGEPVIHVGDVMDLSCRSEAVRMEKIFEASQHPMAILPGNHDGLMFGIYAYNLFAAKLDVGASKWQLACRRGAGDDRPASADDPLTKRGFISTYITEQLKKNPPKPGLETPPESGRHRLDWRNPAPGAFLTDIKGELIDGFGYADSFLAQRLRLPRAPEATRGTVIIALDTNQAGMLVGTWDTIMGRSPGSMGHIRPEQIDAVRGWIDEARTGGDIVIFAGHPNWKSLGLPTRVMLRNLMGDLDHPLVYLSGHTHRGFWAEHRFLSSRPILELNVSSLSDWPILYRRVSFSYDEEAKRIMVHGELVPHGQTPVESYDDLLAAWIATACEKSGVPFDHILKEETELVRRQRESRGTLVGWLISSLGDVCEACEDPLYDHAQTYQDELLELILEVDADLGRDAHALHTLPMPDWCGGKKFDECARMLIAETTSSSEEHRRLFRRKAAMVALLNEHLDDLTSLEARAYMTCRAVLAAKLDFDATDDDHNVNRGEAKCRAEQIFRVQASEGMQ